jgi:F-type H+-transporting ATPase subunit alpha
MQHAIVMIGADDAPPGVQFVAPYAATTIGEHFMRHGRDVLIIYDDLTSHARSYRHVSLLLRRPPGREAFPGDIFYVHSRLLERATHLRDDSGGGSLTALPIIETEAQNVSAYIPTNLISITDGQIYLSPNLFRKGILPAVDVGRSVSRVGGKTQLPAYRAVAGDLRLTYSQFEELEKFARFSSQLDDDTRETLERGKRIRETLKQAQYQPLEVPQQIASLVAVTSGAFDSLPPEEIRQAQQMVERAMQDEFPELSDRIVSGEKLSDEDVSKISEMTRRVLDEPSSNSQQPSGE